MKGKEIKQLVKEGYGKVATKNHSCCDLGSVHTQKIDFAEKISKKIGYTDEDIGSVPDWLSNIFLMGLDIYEKKESPRSHGIL